MTVLLFYCSLLLALADHCKEGLDMDRLKQIEEQSTHRLEAKTNEIQRKSNMLKQYVITTNADYT